MKPNIIKLPIVTISLSNDRCGSYSEDTIFGYKIEPFSPHWPAEKQFQSINTIAQSYDYTTMSPYSELDYLLLEKSVALHYLNELVSSSLKDDLCPVWL